MNKLILKDTTLICIDDQATKKAGIIMEGLCEFVSFTDAKLFSSLEIPCVTNKISAISCKNDYSKFVVKELHNYIKTEYCMIIQTDGYPLNTGAWTDEYYRYDYIGAPWSWVSFSSREKVCPTGKCVGNGGFSFRKTRLLKEVSTYDYDPWDKKMISTHSGNGEDVEEDTFICRIVDEELKQKGFKFAPCELANYFSVENKVYTGQFGFHGPKTVEINKKLGIFKFKDHAFE